MKCTACGGGLEEGFVPDMGHSVVWLAVWMAGSPSTAKSLWEKFKTAGFGLGVGGVPAKAIEAMRCTACGHLELYANHPPKPGTHFSKS